ncbi:hypothetical protein IVB27_38515 [Bradyrhizobium sp. 197]|uniref:hypothetical protein n=1 Tax=Bradyrhizobium sp. 197 TaxID=2782663 RepID=UPI001FFAA9C5|nr:hypothetical protein [Bradyrhizobium sp. 197]MCK1480473.1 hypothetical protein [Bradyrhizobium sp. 197]
MKLTTTKTLYLRSRNGKQTKARLGGKSAPKRSRQVPGSTLRCNDLERFYRDRYGALLPDDDAGRADALIMLHHIYFRQAVDRPWLMNEWLNRCAPFIVGEEREAMIAAVFRRPMKYRADRLAQELGLTFARRQRLGITTIGAIDVTAEQRKERQKMKDTEQHAKRRRDAGRMTRHEYVTASLSKIAPWQVQGISRRTWYRRQKQAAEQAKTHYAADAPVPRISHALVTISLL